MITIQKYSKTDSEVLLALQYTTPYEHNRVSGVIESTHATDIDAQNQYWYSVSQYLNMRVDSYYQLVDSIKHYYFDKDNVPYYNNEWWRINYKKFVEEFEPNYFLEFVQTLQAQARHIIGHEKMLRDTISMFNQAHRQIALLAVDDLLMVARTILKNETKLIKLKQELC